MAVAKRNRSETKVDPSVWQYIRRTSAMNKRFTFDNGSERNGQLTYHTFILCSFQAKNIKDTVEQIRLLERQVAESKTHLNNIVTLIQYCEVCLPLEELRNDGRICN
jgi:hypothetical protein